MAFFSENNWSWPIATYFFYHEETILKRLHQYPSFWKAVFDACIQDCGSNLDHGHIQDCGSNLDHRRRILASLTFAKLWNKEDEEICLTRQYFCSPFDFCCQTWYFFRYLTYMIIALTKYADLGAVLVEIAYFLSMSLYLGWFEII